MKNLPQIFLFLIPFLTGCSKIPDEYKEIEGSYHWSFTEKRVAVMQNVEYQYFDEASENASYTLVIKNRRILFLKNGEKKFSAPIKSVTAFSTINTTISVEFEHPRNTLHYLGVQDKTLTTDYFPLKSNGIEEQPQNTFFKK